MKTLIDWSHWQDDKTGPPPDLSKAAGHGVDGFIFKAGRGAGTVTRLDIDPSFPEFVRQAVQLGVPWGAYWWPEPHELDPLGQARLFFGDGGGGGPAGAPVRGRRRGPSWVGVATARAGGVAAGVRRRAAPPVGEVGDGVLGGLVLGHAGVPGRCGFLGLCVAGVALLPGDTAGARQRVVVVAGGTAAGSGAWVVDVVGVAVLGGREPGRRNVRGGVRRPRFERGARRRVRPVGAASRAGRRCVAGGVSGMSGEPVYKLQALLNVHRGGGRSGEDRRVRGVDIGIVVGDWCSGGVVPAPVRVASHPAGRRRRLVGVAAALTPLVSARTLTTPGCAMPATSRSYESGVACVDDGLSRSWRAAARRRVVVASTRRAGSRLGCRLATGSLHTADSVLTEPVQRAWDQQLTNPVVATNTCAADALGRFEQVRTHAHPFTTCELDSETYRGGTLPVIGTFVAATKSPTTKLRSGSASNSSSVQGVSCTSPVPALLPRHETVNDADPED